MRSQFLKRKVCTESLTGRESRGGKWKSNLFVKLRKVAILRLCSGPWGASAQSSVYVPKGKWVH
jgi:hypothetical protein